MYAIFAIAPALWHNTPRSHMIPTRVLLAVAAVSSVCHGADIPKVWDDQAASSYRIPLAGLGHAPKMVSARDYYALPESNVKTYPVYRPEREPKGYLDWLKAQDPQPLVDVSKLRTDADWIAAGREVFYGRELPRFSGSEHNLQLIRDPRVLDAYRLQTTKEGVLIGLRYVVRKKGEVELGTDTCAMCHVQVSESGNIVEGPPNVHTPFGPLMGDLTRRYQQISPEMLEDRRRKHMREDYRVPFLKDDPNLAVADLPAEEIAKLYDQNPLGVHARTNTSLLYPVKISNLIGIKDLHYFDHTGTARQRDIADLMRYCGSIADVTDALTEYAPGPAGHLKLENMGLGAGVHRTPDALLYALAKYLYSLQPPPNPNPMNDTAKHGREVFEKTGCANCHTPGLYTNNKLTLAEGFQPPAAEAKQLDLLSVSVHTNPGLALKTRKATGFYRVPSLRMVWLDRAFLHDGSIGSLEELFDKARLAPNFRSSNWHSSTAPHAVNGHPFGLDLPPADRTALVAFLRTL
jgi:mono/diheme cytochrome c family protein